MARDEIVYWKSLDELRHETRARAAAAASHGEFQEPLPWKPGAAPLPQTTRRDFLTRMGFSLGAAAAVGTAACSRAPVQHAIPFASEPEELIPGVANWYATTCGGCAANCGLLVKTRDGRPIKIEGNPDSPIFGSGTCAVGQATVLSLYDEERLRGPRWHGQPATWAEIDNRIRAHIDATARASAGAAAGAGVSAGGGRVVLLSGPVSGPATRDLIARCGERHPRFQHVVYEPVSHSALRRAHQQAYGQALVPHYHFDRAAVIVGFEADFLGTWLSPVEFTRQYAARRAPLRSMSRHVQFESGLSLTGANADARHAVSPSTIGRVVLALADRIRAKSAASAASTATVVGPAASPAAGPAVGAAVGAATLAGPTVVLRDPDLPVAVRIVDELADELWAHRGESLIVSGVQDVALQLLIAWMNHQLGNAGTDGRAPIDLASPSQQAQADDAGIEMLVAAMRRGQVAALLVHGVNPAYDYADAPGFIANLERVPLVVSLADRLDETAAHAHAICPDHHFLEAWGDAEPIASYYSLAQPTIAPMFDTRAAQDSLLAWFRDPQAAPKDSDADFHAHLRAHWLEHIHPRQSHEPALDPDRFWDRALQVGFVDLTASPPRSALPPGSAASALPAATAPHVPPAPPAPPAPLAPLAPLAMPPFAADVEAAAVRLHKTLPAAGEMPGGRFEVQLYQSVAMRDGRHANNPWLQELPDPITKLTWGHAAAIAPALAARLGLEDGDVVALGVADAPVDRIELPVCIQPGQAPDTISIALGYGRTQAGRVARGVGANAFPFLSRSRDGLRRTFTAGATLQKTGRRELLALTQTHHSMEGRPLIREATLRDVLGHDVLSRDVLSHPAAAGPARAAAAAAGAEEALPSLWAEHETGRHSWGMAIDLNTCTGCSACIVACQAENNVPVVGKDEVRRGREMHWIRIDRYYSGSEETPDTAFQPVMCQHCANAPCETVCPVLATVHSSDGLNQQVYNRCIGTRYCENNCPYKVRRFNWFSYAQNARFDYVMNSPLETMALNPDVVVRSRGVMEKCSLCVQRIQAGKLAATHDGRPLADGDIRTACQQACPAQAITFGDLHDPTSAATRLQQGPRHYHLLGELGTRPSVGYLTKVRNREV